MNWLEDMFSEISEHTIGNEKRPSRKRSASEICKERALEEDRHSEIFRQLKFWRHRRSDFQDWS